MTKAARIDADDRPYVGLRDDVRCRLGRDGALVWRYNLGSDLDAVVGVALTGTLYAGSDHGTLYAFERPAAPPPD